MSEFDPTVPPKIPIPEGGPGWTREIVLHYLNMRARGGSQVRSWLECREMFGLKVSKHPSGSFLEWERSNRVQEYLAYIKADLNADFKKLPYAKTWERLATLGNLAATLYKRFELEDDKGDDCSPGILISLAKEIRPIMAEIHGHTEGKGLDAVAVESMVEAIEKRVMATKRGKELLGEEKPN